MPTDHDPLPELDILAADFAAHFETKTIPKLVSDVMTVKQMRDDAAGEEAELATLSARLHQEAALFFDLSSAANAMDDVADILQKERQHREAVESELRCLKEKKEQAKNELAQVVDQVDGLRRENELLEVKGKEWQELKRKEATRVVGHMMRTKFRLDKDNRCVSLQLDNESRVESVILVADKENSQQNDLRSSFWEKLSKIYKL